MRSFWKLLKAFSLSLFDTERSRNVSKENLQEFFCELQYINTLGGRLQCGGGAAGCQGNTASRH